MRKALIVGGIVAAVGCLIATSVVSAGPMGKGMAGSPAIGERAGLSEEQTKEMQGIFESTEKAMIEARAELETKRLEMKGLLGEDKPDMARIHAKLSEMESARSRLMEARIERGVRMKGMLTPDQMSKMRQMRGDRMGMMGEGRGMIGREMMMGRQGRAMMMDRGDRAEMGRDMREMHRDRMELRHDRQQLRHDKRELRHDRREMKGDMMKSHRGGRHSVRC